MDAPEEAEVEAVVARLAAGGPLAPHHRDHPLKGNWKGCRDCHVRGDLVLIYSLGPATLKLHRIGSHSELFG
jgi:mRNA interferase YafQ